MSIIAVTIERRYKNYNNEFYVQGIEDEEFFKRYLDTFDHVKIIARVEKVDVCPENHVKFENENISFLPIYTTGTGLRKFAEIWHLANKLYVDNTPVIIRTPGILAYLFSLVCMLKRKKFSLEVVTNPKQEALHSTNFSILNHFLCFVFNLIFKMQLNFSSCVSFVTENEIQDLYLKKEEKSEPKFNSFYSSITLSKLLYTTEQVLDVRSNNYDPINNDTVLLFTGVLDRKFKGLDVFLDIIKQLPVNYKGIVVGDGLLLEDYKEYARQLGVYERVFFTGYISSPEMKKNIMESSDIFILSSRREGLPRVVIEAMSNGLPCVCTNVSGVKELISHSMIYPVDDVLSAKKIILSLKRDDYKKHSKINYLKALDFEKEKLQLKRNIFYIKVRNSESSSFK
ncbi:glycosyltransferase [Erwinia sp. MYb375]|uniref:glycosyltransferase n=1 Tax=unclassified Erwinia TaxID=2622719 RepID=UPI0030A6F90E